MSERDYLVSKAFRLPALTPGARRSAAAARAAKKKSNMERIAAGRAESAQHNAWREQKAYSADRNTFGGAIADVNASGRKLGIGNFISRP